MADQNFYTNDPFGQVVRVLDTYRNQQRQQEDQDLDRKIALVHDLITGPGANPARTAEGLRSILELQAAKGGRGKPAKGAAGFLGKNQEVMPDLLAQIIHGSIPIEGPTETAVPRPQSPAEQGLLPPAVPIPPMGGPSLHDFDGSTILQAPPIQPPPEPFSTQPSGDRMLSAARDMQKYNEGPKFVPLPHEQQPMRIAPEELAQRAGMAAGIKAGATAKATKDAQIQIWKESGLSDDEIKQLLKTQAMGAGTNLQTQDAGYFTIDGKTRHAIRVLSPRTGMWDTVDELSGLPIPPGAVVTAAPSAAGTTDPTSLREFHAVVEDEKNRLGYSPTEDAGFDKWLTTDANRKAASTGARSPHGLTGPQQFAALTKLQAAWNKESKAYSTVINSYNQMQAGLQAADAGMMNPASQAVLVTFQRILDPTSVVRESEYARSPEGLGLIDRMHGWAGRLLQGGAGVPPEELKRFAATARLLIKNLEGSLNSVRGQIKAGADLADLDVQHVFGSETGLPPIAGATPNVPTPPGVVPGADGSIPKPPVDASIVQEAADQHFNGDYAAAAKSFTDKGYTISGTSPVKKK